MLNVNMLKVANMCDLSSWALSAAQCEAATLQTQLTPIVSPNA